MRRWPTSTRSRIESRSLAPQGLVLTTWSWFNCKSLLRLVALQLAVVGCRYALAITIPTPPHSGLPTETSTNTSTHPGAQASVVGNWTPTGFPGRVFISGCPDATNLVQQTVANCEAICDKKKGCTAINIDVKSGACALRACPCGTKLVPTRAGIVPDRAENPAILNK